MSTHIAWSRRAVASFGMLLGLSSAASAAGPDIVYSGINDTLTYTVTGSPVRAFMLGTSTCNVGDQPANWINNGPPGVGFEMYRLHNGRMVQIGLSWVKHACCAAEVTSAMCGPSCTSTPGSNMLGKGCLDTYTASWNAGQGRLGPRSNINPYSGAFGVLPGGSGSSIDRRLQVADADLSAATYPGALYFAEGVYVATDDALSFNWLNNASYRRVTVSGSLTMALADSIQTSIPAIQAWHDHGLGVGVVDPGVDVFAADVPGEGRFWVANKVTNLGGGSYLYDYAVFNLNSDRGCGSLSVPRPVGSSVSGEGFHDVFYHSGELVDGADWAQSTTSCAVSWTVNPPPGGQQANYIHWGTMYNFWFTCNRAPVNGTVTLGLYKTGSPASLALATRVPGGACATLMGDVDGNGQIDGRDAQHMVDCLLTGATVGGDCACADMDLTCPVAPPDVPLFVNAALGL